MAQHAMVVFQHLLDARMKTARAAMLEVIPAMTRTAPDGAGDALKLAASEYFAQQEREFLAVLNQLFPDAKSKVTE
jgi:hypothetical protein